MTRIREIGLITNPAPSADTGEIQATVTRYALNAAIAALITDSRMEIVRATSAIVRHGRRPHHDALRGRLGDGSTATPSTSATTGHSLSLGVCLEGVR